MNKKYLDCLYNLTKFVLIFKKFLIFLGGSGPFLCVRNDNHFQIKILNSLVIFSQLKNNTKLKFVRLLTKNSSTNSVFSMYNFIMTFDSTIIHVNTILNIYHNSILWKLQYVFNPKCVLKICIF